MCVTGWDGKYWADYPILVSKLINNLYLLQLPPQGPSSFGLLFDIDGVLVRGRTPIPAAKQCFKNLVDQNGRYKMPVVFVTNAGNCMRQTKAEHLSQLLEVEVNHIPSKLVIWFRCFGFLWHRLLCLGVSGPGDAVSQSPENVYPVSQNVCAGLRTGSCRGGCLQVSFVHWQRLHTVDPDNPSSIYSVCFCSCFTLSVFNLCTGMCCYTFCLAVPVWLVKFFGGEFNFLFFLMIWHSDCSLKCKRIAL